MISTKNCLRVTVSGAITLFPRLRPSSAEIQSRLHLYEEVANRAHSWKCDRSEGSGPLEWPWSRRSKGPRATLPTQAAKRRTYSVLAISVKCNGGRGKLVHCPLLTGTAW
jgi:hypothetical protein